MNKTPTYQVVKYYETCKRINLLNKSALTKLYLNVIYNEPCTKHKQ